MKRFAVAALLFAVPAQAADTLTAAMKDFYDVYQSQPDHGGGIPDATGRLHYAAVLSPRLNKLMADAAAAQARMGARAKGAGPKSAVMPVLEGDIFTSYFDGATSWQFGPCEGALSKGDVQCSVFMTHVSRAQPDHSPSKPVTWTDRVEMVTTPGGWKVDEVVYDRAFPSGNTGQLSDILAMVAATNP
jgi:hypothetical protein